MVRRRPVQIYSPALYRHSFSVEISTDDYAASDDDDGERRTDHAASRDCSRHYSIEEYDAHRFHVRRHHFEFESGTDDGRSTENTFEKDYRPGSAEEDAWEIETFCGDAGDETG